MTAKVARMGVRIYEVGIDGKGLRQLTNSNYDDVDPCYGVILYEENGMFYGCNILICDYCTNFMLFYK